MMSDTLKQNQLIYLMDEKIIHNVVSDVPCEINKIGKHLEANTKIEEVEQAECDCCGLKEECTQDYIATVKLLYSGKWVCGLCSEAVKEISTETSRTEDIEVAINHHKMFCQEFNGTARLNPKLSLTTSMRKIARRSFENRRSHDSFDSKITRSSSCLPKF